MDDEIKTYLSNVAKLAPKTHAAYKLTLDLFQQSCSRIFVHQVTKQDLQASCITFPAGTTVHQVEAARA